MNKRNFGKVVKSLRQEQFDFTSGRAWTQAQLAQAANLSTAIIGKIEQGRRASLSGAVLLQLADALQLSTLERREFFAAATEVEQSRIATDSVSAQRMFQYVWDIFYDVQLPAYIIDPFADLLGVNAALMRFYNVKLDALHAARDSAIGCNMLSLMFRPSTLLYDSMGERWEAIAAANIAQFRFTSLRFRHTERFTLLLHHLKQHADFVRLYGQMQRATADHYSQLRLFRYDHAKFGAVHYTATLTSTLTPCGHLYMIVFVPCDAITKMLFDKLTPCNAQPERVMPWPHPELTP